MIELNPWCVKISKPKNVRLRVFCFHYGGGGASAFRDWQRYINPNVEIICIQLPGRESRFTEPFIDDFSVVIKHITLAVQPYLKLPYVFFGHSLGALISYHVASAITQMNLPIPRHLILSGCPAPSDQTKYYKKISHLPDKEFIEALKAYGGTPDALLNNIELMSVYLPILRSDFKLAENKHRLDHKLSCPIMVFGGLKDKIPKEKLALWGQETDNDFNLRMFPGGHFFIIESQLKVLDQLDKLLGEISNSIGDLKVQMNS